ncbi:MAG: hypothetical protein WBO58_00455 [Gammaproteobacteria bacterium]
MLSVLSRPFTIKENRSREVDRKFALRDADLAHLGYNSGAKQSSTIHER